MQERDRERVRARERARQSESKRERERERERETWQQYSMRFSAHIDAITIVAAIYESDIAIQLEFITKVPSVYNMKAIVL